MTKYAHAQLKKTALSRLGVKREYDALNEEFQLLKEMIQARKKARKTQEEVAEVMKTSTSVVGRLETGGGKHKHSPTLETLREYARAVESQLEIRFVYVGPSHSSTIKRTSADSEAILSQPHKKKN